MELGVVAPVVVALFFAAYAMRMFALLRAEGGRSFTLLQLGAGLGMLPMMLHSVFDFALHMPANAMWFATLAGVTFHRMVGPREGVHEVRKARHEERQIAAAPSLELPPVPEAVNRPRGA
jgi:hypothetical protein